MLLRSMTPEVIAADELGSQEDRYALESVFHCGCHLVATAHGTSFAASARSPLLHTLFQQRLFLLSGRPSPGTVIQISDADGNLLDTGCKVALQEIS